MEDEIELSDYYFIIKKNIGLIFLLFFLILVAVAAYTFLTTPVYQGRSLLVVNVQDEVASLLNNIQSKADINTEVEIIKSASVVGKIVGFNTRLDIEILPIKGSNVVEIIVQSPNRLEAQQTANKIADEYVLSSLSDVRKSAIETGNLVEKQIKDTLKELDELNSQLIAFQELQEKSVDEELQYQNIKRNVKLLERRQNTLLKESDNVQYLLNQDMISKNEDRLPTDERKDLMTTMQLIKDELDDIGDNLTTLNKQVLDLDEIKKLSPQDEIKYLSLLQGIQVKEDRYNFLLGRSEEIQQLEQKTGTDAKVIEYAELPILPVKPNIPVYLALGFMLAIIGSIGLVFLKEYLRDTYKSVREIEQKFGPVIMGTIPKVRKNKNDYHLLAHRKEHVPESIRMLRTNFKFHLKESKIKMIAVVSPQRGDGKSTVAYNLAHSITDAKVLLVDANIRHPKVESIFHPKKWNWFKKDITKTAVGLSDVIMGDVKLEDAILKKGAMNILFAGSPNTSPSELLSSQRMKDILLKLKRSAYDIIIFDCNSLDYSETLVLSTEVEGVLMVVGFDKTRREQSIKAKNSLEKVKAKIIGVAINFLK